MPVGFMQRFAPLLWIGVTVAAILVLTQRAQDFSASALLAHLQSFSPSTLALALLSCTIAFAILSAYEIIIVRHVTGQKLFSTAARTAWIANSIGHFVGAALLSGGALRYRLYAAKGLTLAQVSRITVLAAIPYLLAAGWMLDIALVWFAEDAARALRLPVQIVQTLGIAGLIKDIGWLVLVVRRREITVFRWTLGLPSLSLTLTQIIVGVTEMILVAFVLYSFLPTSLRGDLIAFTGIFVIAATAAQLSHVPAGLGVLEAALLLLLPQMSANATLAAVLCYRGIFELLPLGIGGAMLLHAELQPGRATQ